MNIRPIHNHIIFQFCDEVTEKGHFMNKTDWGLELGVQYLDDTKRPRLGTIVYVGDEVEEELKPGVVVLIDALKWTNYFMHEEQKYWRTDSEQVLGIYNTD